jgi:hypothetical protein
MSILDSYEYGINSTSAGFSKLEPWSVEIEDVKITWVPGSPYIIGDDSSEAEEVIYQINKFINFSEVDEDGAYMLTPVGPIFAGNNSSPYMVRHAIESIYGDTTDLVFSETAPELEPEDQEDEVIPADRDFNDPEEQPTN